MCTHFDTVLHEHEGLLFQCCKDRCSSTSKHDGLIARHALRCVCLQAGERQADVLSRQVSKSSTESQDLARERELLLDKLRAAEQVRLCLHIFSELRMSYHAMHAYGLC